MTTDAAVAPPPWSLMAGAPPTPGEPSGNRLISADRDLEKGRGQDFSAYMSDVAASHDRMAIAKPLNPQPGFGEDGFGVDDFVDMINPLQHLPVISNAYRALTGDEISPGARLAGGTLYGGPLGLASALINGAIEQETGRDIGGTVMAALFGDDAAPGPQPETGGTAIAAAPQQAPDGTSDIAADRANQAAALDAAADTLADTAPAAGTQVAAAAPLFAASSGPLIQAPQRGPLIGGQTASPFAAVPPNGPPNVLAGQEPPQRPLQAAGQGVPTLSPDAATALMRMAQQSAAPPITAPITAPTPPAAQTAQSDERAAMITPPPAAAEPRPQIVPSARPTLTVSESVGSSASDETRIGFVEPVASADLPSAMMEALSRYEAMKSGG